MTTIENSLALQIIQEYYGELVKQICNHLIEKKSYPLVQLSTDLNLDNKLVAQILAILINHNLIEYKLNSRQFIEYKFNTKKALDLLKITKYIKYAYTYYGKIGSIIIEQMCLHGTLQMSILILKILAKILNENMQTKQDILNDSSKLYSYLNEIKEIFQKLVNDNYIERLAQLIDYQNGTNLNNNSKQNNINNNSDKVPKFNCLNEFERFCLPELKFDDSKMFYLLEQNDLIENSLILNEDFGDINIYWKLNEKRFMQTFRDKAIVEAIENRIDKNGANLINVILRLTDSKIASDKASQNSHQSKTITTIDIQKEMRVEYNMDTITIDKYLSVILQDSFKVLEKVGDFSGGAYCIDFKKSLRNLCVAHIESYIRERYGSKSLRIFRVIMDKSQLEQKQIEDFSMIPAKDCKAMLYAMLNDGMLCITELSKTSDHAPSRTYYLFYVDIYQICKKLLEHSYHGMLNMILKREYLTSENKRLLEKNKKVNSIIESLKSQGAEQTEIDDVKQMISQDELNSLNSFNDHSKKIELAELQLEETINIFELYFYYHTVAPIITTGRAK